MRIAFASAALFVAAASASWLEQPVQVNQPIYPPNGANYPVIAPTPNSTYEYAIVGSGPGGGALAARLALAGHSVLLIDAGEDHGNDRQVQVPALHPYSSEYNAIKWDYFVDHYADPTQARKDSKYTYRTPEGAYWTRIDASSDQPPAGSQPVGVLYPRTGALGGCSMHNALITVLPTAGDWDGIASLTGDRSWAADNMLQYFKRLENNGYLQGALQSSGHGFDGWLPTNLTPTSLIAQDTKVLSLLLAAAAATGKGVLGGLLGLASNLASVLTLDINTPSKSRDTGKEDLYQIPLAMDKNYVRRGPRDFVIDTATAVDANGAKKYKLDIVLNTLVTKVTFDQSGTVPKATGVDYLHGKSLYRADARSTNSTGGIKGHITVSREVIVSAGAFNTPQILKLSGVGPAAELEAHGIPVVKDLPGVGGNLQDRYEVGIVGQAPTKFDLLKACTFLGAFGIQGEDPCYQKWATLSGDAKGSYTTNGIAFGLMHHSSVAGADPDLFLGGVPAYFNGYFPGYSKHATESLDMWTWLTLKAHSRNNAGTVNLTSADPCDTPRITFNSFAGADGEKDLTAVVEGMKYGIREFEKVGAGLLGLNLPSVDLPLLETFTRVWPPTNVSSDDQLREFARNEAWGHHASCTAPIGADNDPLAVLDSKLSVRGVQGLRVVDASVFPKIPGTYIALPIYMVSEKAADIILSNV